MLDLEIIDEPAIASVALDPFRCRLLAEMTQPVSAAMLATRVGLTRQKVNYHLRTLEAHGLIEAAGEKSWGGLTERLMVAKAHSYLVSPVALGPIATDPERTKDRLSVAYLVALAARAIREVGSLLRLSRDSGKRLATLSADTEIRFRSAAERAAFSADLTRSIAQLVARYHDAQAEGGRWHRLVVLAYPSGPKESKESKDTKDKE